MISSKKTHLPLFFVFIYVLMQSAFSQLADTPVAMDKAPFHVPVFSNDYVTMLRINIPPGRDTGFHTHYFDSVSVTPCSLRAVLSAFNIALMLPNAPNSATKRPPGFVAV